MQGRRPRRAAVSPCFPRRWLGLRLCGPSGLGWGQAVHGRTAHAEVGETSTWQGAPSVCPTRVIGLRRPLCCRLSDLDLSDLIKILLKLD